MGVVRCGVVLAAVAILRADVLEGWFMQHRGFASQSILTLTSHLRFSIEEDMARSDGRPFLIYPEGCVTTGVSAVMQYQQVN